MLLPALDPARPAACRPAHPSATVPRARTCLARPRRHPAPAAGAQGRPRAQHAACAGGARLGLRGGAAAGGQAQDGSAAVRCGVWAAARVQVQGSGFTVQGGLLCTEGSAAVRGGVWAARVVVGLRLRGGSGCTVQGGLQCREGGAACAAAGGQAQVEALRCGGVGGEVAGVGPMLQGSTMVPGGGVVGMVWVTMA